MLLKYFNDVELICKLIKVKKNELNKIFNNFVIFKLENKY